MSNHEIETRLPPPEGGGGLHDQGTLLHSVCMRHESGLRIAIRRTKIVVHRPGEDKYWHCWIVQRAGLFGASDPPPLCKWEEMPVHILSLEQQTTPEARLFPPNAPFDRAGFTINENTMFDDLASGRMFGSGSPIFNPCDWTTRGGPWGFGAWSFYWCDAAGDVCDGTSAHEINSDTPSAGPGGRGRIGEQELNASALRKAAASIEFRYKAVGPPSEANQLPAHGGSTQCGPLETIRPPRVNREDTVFGGLRLTPSGAIFTNPDMPGFSNALVDGSPAPTPTAAPAAAPALVPPPAEERRCGLSFGASAPAASAFANPSSFGAPAAPSAFVYVVGERVRMVDTPELECGSNIRAGDVCIIESIDSDLRPRSRCGTRRPTCARTAPRRSLKSIRRRKRRRRRRGWSPR